MSRPPWGWAVLSMGLCLAVCWGALDGIPHVTDEVVYTLQSRIFAAGARTAPAADVPSMLSYPFWVTGPQSHAAFPFGWPLLLALGEVTGLAWLVNPVLMGVAVLLTWSVGRRLTEEGAARLGAIGVAVSPALVMLGASRMSHISVMVGLLMGLQAVVAETCPPRGPGESDRSPPRPRGGRLLLGGLGVAYCVLARPFDALLLGGPLLAWGLLRLPGAWGARLLWVLPSAVAAAWVLVDNHMITGSFSTFPADAFFASWSPERPGCNRLGFGPELGCVPVEGTFGHSLEGALGQAWDRAVLLDRLILGLPGGLLLAGITVAWIRRPLLALPLAVVAAGHLLYWSPGMAYGPRFWALGVPGLCLAVGIAAHRASRGRPWARWLPGLVVASSLAGLSQLWPELSDRYWCVDGRLRDHVQTLEADEGLLLLRAKGKRATGWPRLGVPDFTCDPMLEAGDGLVLWDPMGAGWQVRHALPDAQIPVYRERHQPGMPAWMVLQDVKADERTVLALPD